MQYKYKKGRIINKGTPSFCYVITSNNLETTFSGISLITKDTNDITEFINLCKEDNARKIILVDLSQTDFDLIINELKNITQEIEVHNTSLKAMNYEKLALCTQLIDIKIKCFRANVSLWEVSNNNLLESLEISGVKRIDNQEKLVNSSISTLIIRNRDSNLNSTNYPIINDFRIFELMPKLKTLDLFIGPKDNKEQDLIALSRLSNIERINLPKGYFSFNQYAWLSSKLPKVSGIGCIKEERWNKRIEKMEYTINGINMPWEYKDYYGDGIKKYLLKFDRLVEKYKNDDNSPL